MGNHRRQSHKALCREEVEEEEEEQWAIPEGPATPRICAREETKPKSAPQLAAGSGSSGHGAAAAATAPQAVRVSV